MREGRLEEIRQRAAAGNYGMQGQLARSLTFDPDELRRLADATNDHYRRNELLDLLALRGDAAGIRNSRRFEFDDHAHRRYADVLAERGDVSDLQQLCANGFGWAGHQLERLAREGLLAEAHAHHLLRYGLDVAGKPAPEW